MKKRAVSELKKLIVILAVGFGYYLVVLHFKAGIPCLFNKFTGLLCPGCGVTRMIMSMLKLDFAAAYGYNKALFLTLPLILFAVVSIETDYISTGKRRARPFVRWLLIIEIIILVLFGIIRNII